MVARKLRWPPDSVLPQHYRYSARSILGQPLGKRVSFLKNTSGEEFAVELTRDFKETIQTRVRQDPAFREELFREGIQCLLTGDADTGKAILRDYINATIGFEKLGNLTERSAKSLMRMFSSKGNPQAKNLFEILGYLQEKEGVRLEVHSVKRSQRRDSRSLHRTRKRASQAA